MIKSSKILEEDLVIGLGGTQSYMISSSAEEGNEREIVNKGEETQNYELKAKTRHQNEEIKKKIYILENNFVMPATYTPSIITILNGCSRVGNRHAPQKCNRYYKKS